MNKLPAFTLGVLLLIVNASPRASADVPQPVVPEFSARAFLANVDFEKPGMQEVRELFQKGEYDRALAAWRDHVVYRLRGLPLGQFVFHYHRTFPDHQKACEEWLKQAEHTDADVQATSRGRHGPELAYYYLRTRDDNAIRRFLEDDDRAARMGYFADGNGPTGPHQIWTLATLAKLLPDGQPLPEWASVGAARSGTVSPQSLELFPPVTMARLAEALVLQLPTSPDGLVKNVQAGGVPNQRVGVLSGYMMVAAAFDTFKPAEELRRIVADAVRDVLDGTYYADGGNIERSFNYTIGVTQSLEELAGYFPGVGGEWSEQLSQLAVGFWHQLLGLTTPWGTLPQVGNYTGCQKVPPLWLNQKERDAFAAGILKDIARFPRQSEYDRTLRALVEKLYGQRKEEVLPFTSVGYPYTGFYALRGGWTWDAPYAFFNGSRPTRGHSMIDRNGLQLAAFGRRMIVNAGTDTYGFGTMPDAVRRYFGEASWYKCNTVLVDGQGQTDVDGVSLRVSKQPIPLRWHTSPQLDMVEGLHDSGFGEGFNASKRGKQKIDTSVRHLRQLLFIKGDTPLWIVTDRMLSADPAKMHRYTQMWHFPPPEVSGFKREQVVIDQAARTVRTDDPAGPNLFLRHFADRPLEYQSFWGKEDAPALGWYAQAQGGGVSTALDLHASWEGAGDQTLMTVLAPSRTQEDPLRDAKDLSGNGICATRLVLRDGRILHYMAAKTPAQLSTPEASATASALLTLTDGSGKLLGGMALDCTTLTVSGKNVALELPDVQFVPNAEGHVQATPIFRRLAPEINVTCTAFPDFQAAEPVTLNSPEAGLEIRYTLDGSEPDLRSPRYVAPIKIPGPCVLKARLVKGSLLYPDVTTESFSLVTSLRAPDAPQGRLERGLRFAYFQADGTTWSTVLAAAVGRKGTLQGIDPTSTGTLDYFSTSPWQVPFRNAIEFSGYLEVPRDGLYSFDKKEVLLYFDTPKRSLPISVEAGSKVPLKAGKHRFRAIYLYFAASPPKAKGERIIPFYISGPGIPSQPLPQEWLWRDAE